MNEGKEFQLVSLEGTSAKEALAKLHREIERIYVDPKTEFAVDHVMNAFWTAWHMYAWVWEAIKDRPALRDAVIKYRGIEDENIGDASSFGTALARRFVPLKICRVIAMGGRHVHVTWSAENDHDSAGSSRGAHGANKPAREHARATQPTPMVVVMGRGVSVIQLLREVEEYWVTLIHENGVEQLR